VRNDLAKAVGKLQPATVNRYLPEFQVKNTHYISFLAAKVCGPRL
jgi:hypothetical protein